MASSLDDLTQPLDDPKRKFGNSFFEDPAPASLPSRREAAVNRIRAADLAERGIPTYKDEQGAVSALRDETGAALNAVDNRYGIAYDSKGQPKQISYGETGPPVLTDAFDTLPARVDPSTGYIERKGKGLYRYEGQDPTVTAELAQKTKDKNIKEQSSLLGERISLDRATKTNLEVDQVDAGEKLLTAVPVLNDPKFKGADLPTVKKAIDEHFNAQYASPEANASTGWFGDGLSPEAELVRQKIDEQKAGAHEAADRYHELTQTIGGLDVKVRQEMTTRGEHIDTLLAHSRGEAGPLDQVSPTNPAISQAAPGLYPPEADQARMLGGQPLEPDKPRAITMAPMSVSPTGEPVTMSLDERRERSRSSLEAVARTPLDFFEKWENIKDDPAQLVPFLAGAKDLYEIGGVALAAKRLSDADKAGTDPDPQDLQLVKEFTEFQARDTTFGYKVLNVIAMLPSFAGELLTTGGIYTAGSKGALKLGEKALKHFGSKAGVELIEKLQARVTAKAAGQIVEDTVSKSAGGKIAEVGLRTLATIGGGAAQTVPASSFRIAASTVERMMPEFQFSNDDKGVLSAHVVKEGDDFLPAFTKAFGDQAIEVISEHSGGALKLIPGAQKIGLIKTALMKRWFGLNPNATAGTFTKMVQNAGWNGVIGEMFEERVGAVARSAVGLQSWQEAIPTAEGLAVELIAFGIPGVAVGGVNVLINKAAPKSGPMPNGETPTSPETPTGPVPTEKAANAKVISPVGEAPTPSVDTAAHEAATSPENGLTEPTDAQKKAGNYQKGHVSIGGLDISIENPAGSKRKPEFEPLKSHYGYVKGTVGADKDHVDIFVKPGFEKQGMPNDYSGPVFVVNQYKASGKFDEHKAVLGVATAGEAKKEYLSNYPKGWTGGKSVVKFDSPAEFKAWATGGPKGPAVQPIKVVAPEGGSLHASQIEGPHVVSTAVKQNGQYLVGSKWNEPHAGVGIRHGLDDVAQADRGFIVQDAAGNRTFATRAEAESIAQKAGQIKGVIGDNGLQSEHLQEAAKPEVSVKPTVEPTEDIRTKVGKLDRRASELEKRLTALKDVPATKAVVIRTLLKAGTGKTLDQAEAQLVKLESAGLPEKTPVTKGDEQASEAGAESEAPKGSTVGVPPDTGLSTKPATQEPGPEKVAERRPFRETVAKWEKGREPDLTRLGTKLVEKPTGPAGLFYDILANEIHYDLAAFEKDAASLPEGADPHELLESRLHEEHAHAADMRAAGGNLTGHLLLWGSLPGPNKAAVRSVLAGNQAVEQDSPHAQAAEYIARLFMHRQGLELPESHFRDVTSLVVVLDGPQSAQIEAHLAKMEAAVGEKAPSGAPADEMGDALDALVSDLFAEEPKKKAPDAAVAVEPAKAVKVKKSKLSDEEQALIDEATNGLFATPAANGVTEQKSVEAERVAKFSKLARMILSKGIDTPKGAADFMKANIGDKMLPYAQALWDAMALSKPELYGTHNWDALFAGKKAPVTASPIEDFGEKIGGARKDKWAERGLQSGDLEGMTDIERNAYATRDNVWPIPDYAQLIADGMPKPIAWLVKDVRSQISKAPVIRAKGELDPVEQGSLLRQYIDTVGQLRDGLSKVRSTQDIKDLWSRLFGAGAGSTIGTRVYGLVARRTGYRTKLSNLMQPSTYDEDRAKRLLETYNEGWPTPQEAWQRMFEVKMFKAGSKLWTSEKGHHTIEKDEWMVKRRNDSRVMKDGLATEAEAIEFAKSSVPAAGERLTRPFKGDAGRVGPDYREGKDITGEQILQTFGFRGGEFGHWTNQADRQQSLNQAFDGLKDLARVLRLPDAAISLNGELGIAFGARGSGKAAAHYEPVKVVINLTKTQGSGSLAHEWGHALDDYFGKQAGKPAAAFASHDISGGPGNRPVRHEVVTAWQNVMKSITKKTASTELVVAEAQAKLDRSRGNADSWVRGKAQTIQDPRKEEQFHHIMAMLRMEEPRLLPSLPLEPREEQLVDELQTLLGPHKLDAKSKKALIGNAYWAARYYKGVERAIAGEVVQSGPTDFYAAALKKEKGDKDGYWARLHEMFARAFESFVQRKFGAEGGTSDYLVHSARGDAMSAWGALYPSEPESTDIDKAFEELWGAIKTETTDKGTKLYATPVPDADRQAEWLEKKAGLHGMTVTALVNNEPLFTKLAADWRNTHPGGVALRVTGIPFHDTGAGLFATPVQVGIPEGKEDQFLAVARAMIQGGINTPKAFSDYLEGRYGEKMRPYYQALWNALGIVDNKLRGQHNWEQLRQVAPEPEPAADTKSFAAEMNVTGDKEDSYSGNGLRFLTRDAAETYANDLMSRWMAVRKYRVVPSADEPTHDGNGDAIEAPAPDASPTTQLADWVIERLDATERFKSGELFAAADRIFGGTMGEAKYTSKDAYDAMELGVNRWILAKGVKPEGTLAEAKDRARGLQKVIDLLPSQTKRTEEQQEFQQFSTPPPFAFAAAWVADMTPNDVVAETSAGIGGLAIFAKLAGATVHVNELSDRRAAILRTLFENVTEHDAELWHALQPDTHPTVGLINPAFSATAGRTATNTSMNGAKQIESLLNSLEPGGRLVTITGEGMAADRSAFTDWWKKIAEEYDVRANIGVDGHLYQKYGTTFDNQLVVIDKPLAGNKPVSYAPVTGKVETYDHLLDLLSPIRDLRRAQGSAEATPEPPGSIDTGAGGADTTAVDESGLSPTGGVGLGTGGGRRPGGGEGATGGAELVGRPESGGGSVSTGEPGSGGELAGATTRPIGSGHESPRFGGDSLGESPSGVELNVAPTEFEDAEVTDAIFVPWSSHVDIPGAQKHPTPLVESASMASVDVPAVTYKPKLRPEIIESGDLSDAQIMPVIMAGQAHETVLPDGTRQGYVVGDGTGVGKGRIIAGIIQDNRNHGRKKAIWISKSEDLIGEYPSERVPGGADAKRDLAGVGDREIPITTLGNVKSKTGAIGLKEGILFTSYSTMKGENQLAAYPPEFRPTAVVMVRSQEQNGTITKVRTSKGQTLLTIKMADGFILSDVKSSLVSPVTPAKGNKSRIDQIVEWVGADFDGVIAFDESQAGSNSIAIGGKRGATSPSQQAIAMLDIQKRLPNARLVYVSATFATEVHNLAYADRLGIWGPGAFFPNKLDFITKVSSVGLSAMEIIARDLKALGLMNARTLSFGPINPDDPKDNGVEYDVLEHKFTPDQKVLYDEMARSWQLVFKNMTQALELSGANLNAQAKGNARGAYFSAAQRFFNQTLTAMQMPTVLADMHQAIDAGESILVQIVNTNLSSLDREILKMESEERGLDTVDTSPLNLLKQYLDKSFPTALFQVITNADGSVTSVMVIGPDGLPVQDPKAVAMKNALIEKIDALPVPANPLEQILDEFGPEMVAEITGRNKRIVWGEVDGVRQRILEKRSGSTLKKESQDYNDDKRRILVFSGKGDTGFTYSSDKNFVNQRRRIHFVLQPGWRADRAVQGAGRGHRANEANAPFIKLARTDLDAHKRFTSTIAKRMSMLGAMTAGERRSTGQGLFSAADDLENEYSKRALDAIIEESYNQVPGSLPWKELIEDKLGLDNLVKEDGTLSDTKMPPVSQFLNRLLALEFEEGNRVFNVFFARLEQNIMLAQEHGTYDPGLQILDPGKGGQIEKKSDDPVYTHPGSGGITRLVEVEISSPSKFLSWQDLFERYKKEPDKVIENKRSGSLFAIYPAGNFTDRKTGRVVPQVRKVNIKHADFVPTTEVESGHPDDRFTEIPLGDAPALWAKQISEADPVHREKKTFLVGLFLPIWNKLSMIDRVRVYQFKTTERERILGILIPPRSVENVRKALGMGMKVRTPEEVLKQVKDFGLAFALANGWRMGRAKIAGEYRVEVRGPMPADSDNLTGYVGLFKEIIAFKPRYFVPTTESGVQVMKRLLAQSPITSEGTSTLTATPALNEGGEEIIEGDRVRLPIGKTGTVIEVRGTGATVALDEGGITPAKNIGLTLIRPVVPLATKLFATPFKNDASDEQKRLAKDRRGTLEDRRPPLVRVTEWWNDFRHDAARNFEAGVFDTFSPIRRINVDAWKAAHLTQELPSVISHLLDHGQIEFDGTWFRPKADTKGLLNELKDVLSHPEKASLWELYVTAYRSDRLLEEGREHNFGRSGGTWSKTAARAEIDEALKLAETYPEFETARQAYSKFNRSILDLAEKTGLINAEQRALFENEDYVPFYRIAEEADARPTGPGTQRTIANQRAKIRRLKGAGQSVAVLENIYRNMETMIDAAFKNAAMQKIVDSFLDAGVIQKEPKERVSFTASVNEIKAKLKAEGVNLEGGDLDSMVQFWRSRAPKDPEVVSVMRDGKPEYYRIDDPLLLRAVLDLGPDQFGLMIKTMGKFRSLLTSAVTLDPVFSVANFTRDTLAAWIQYDGKMTPGISAAKGLLKALRESEELQKIMAGGGGLGTYHRLSAKEVRKHFLGKSAGRSIMLETPRQIARFVVRMQRASENANRVAVFERVEKAGGSSLDAAFAAKDVLNFGSRGGFTTIKLLAQVLPFFNARLQGLNKLGRSSGLGGSGGGSGGPSAGDRRGMGAGGNPKSFFLRAGLMMAAALAVATLASDEEEYQALEDWDRDTYFHFWIAGAHIRIPKPFELGFIFATIPERITQAFRTGDFRQLGTRFLAGVSDSLAFNPVPQMIRPAVEQWGNKEMFTGRDIVSPVMKFQPPEKQFSPGTSETFKGVAQAMPDSAPGWMRSPVRLEHLFRGYFASLGMYALGVTDAIFNTVTDIPVKPGRTVDKIPIVNSFMRRFFPNDAARSTRFVGEFYELQGELNQTIGHIKDLEKTGDSVEAGQERFRNRVLLSREPAVDAAAKEMKDLRKQRGEIIVSRTLSAAQKQVQSELITARINRLAAAVVKNTPKDQPVIQESIVRAKASDYKRGRKAFTGF